MSINAFPKQTVVKFDEAFQMFEDALVISNAVVTKDYDPVLMEQSGDTIWLEQPYIMRSFDGWDQTNNFNAQTQLAVPITLANIKSVPFIISATESRDSSQQNSMEKGGKYKLASDINLSLMQEAAKGSLVVKRTVAATGFDDIGLCEVIMNERGVPQHDRFALIGPRDYLPMASNLQALSRSFDGSKSVNAYEKALLGSSVANFNVLKGDYSLRLAIQGGGAGITISTLDTTGQYYRPSAMSVGAGSLQSPTDNRYQTVTVSSTTGITGAGYNSSGVYNAGDAFTIAGLNSVHMETKQDTGQLMTFRVNRVLTSTTMEISPPIITNQLFDSDSAAQYQNCVINTKSATSAIVFLNTVAAPINPFWQKDSIVIVPGKWTPPTNVDYLQAETKQGIQLTLTRQWDVKTQKMLDRVDVFWGTANLQPMQNGIMLFNQT